MVTGGEQAVRIWATRSCAEVFALLAAGEWSMTERAVAPVGVPIPSLAVLERGDEAALVQSTGPAAFRMDGETMTPVEPSMDYCQATLEQMKPQPLEARGAENAQGEARLYPLRGAPFNGCLELEGALQFLGLYEGPGDFRALVSLAFAIPAEPGEYALDSESVELTIARSDKTVVGLLAEMFRGIESGLEDAASSLDPDQRDYLASSETPGTIRIASIDPLEGEVMLTDMEDDSGAPQTFRAGFICYRIP